MNSTRSSTKPEAFDTIKCLTEMLLDEMASEYRSISDG